MRYLIVISGLLLISCGDYATEPVAAPRTVELAIASNTWVTRADMPGTQRWNLAIASIATTSGYSKLYAIGGATATGGSLSTHQMYNAATNSWTYKASLPGPRYRTNGIGVIKGKLYISGGISSYRNYRSELFVYNPATNMWAQKAWMPYVTYGGFTGVINDKLYVLTGCDDFEWCTGPGDPDLDLFRYDPSTDRWTSLAPPPQRHYDGVAGTIGGKFYVVGGRTNFGDLIAELHVYDPATNLWSTKAPLPRPRDSAVGTVVDGKLYVVGGRERQADGTEQWVRSTLVYSPTTNSWITKRSIPSTRDRVAAARVAVNGLSSLEIVGGAT